MLRSFLAFADVANKLRLTLYVRRPTDPPSRMARNWLLTGTKSKMTNSAFPLNTSDAALSHSSNCLISWGEQGISWDINRVVVLLRFARILSSCFPDVAEINRKWIYCQSWTCLLGSLHECDDRWSWDLIGDGAWGNTGNKSRTIFLNVKWWMFRSTWYHIYWFYGRHRGHDILLGTEEVG